MKTIFGGVPALFAISYLCAAPLYAARPFPAPRVASSQSSDPSAAGRRALLDQYCVTCHNERLRTANLVLEKDEIGADQVASGAAVWEKVLQKLRAGSMPPVGRPRPDPSAVAAFAAWLESSLDRAAEAAPNPGRPTIHRLNRTEYTNAVRDVLALDIDGRSLLPGDDFGYGFDNNADVLAVSPGLLERYMSAARKISRLAIGDPTIRPAVEIYEVSRYLLQDDRASEELPFGSRGGIAIRHHFPLDGEYVVTIHLQRRRSQEPQQLEVRVDGEPIKVFKIGQPGGAPRLPDEPDDQSAGAGLEVRFPARAGPRLVGVAFLQRTVATEGVGPAYLPVGNISFRGKRGAEVGLERVEIGGPYDARGPGDTPSRRRIFVCRPGKGQAVEPCASKILASLARRAYRRPVSEKDVQKLLGFFRTARHEKGFDGGIQSALERILVDPQFLFRIEREPVNMPPGAPYRLSDVELASRLSFFLWSSVPDDELLDLAARGRLHDSLELERQVRRMLADSRATSLVSNFAAQWLYVRNMQAVVPDVNAFPGFDDNLREAFQRETELFLDSQLREDRSVTDLLTANYTFVNERLARHYGIPNIYGSHFRRVTFADENRGGLLGQGSILTVTSYATRTSPVVRGKWLLENILGAPPPAPPPNVPNLPDSGAEGKLASMRERMEQHRKNPACASCHAQMDPLGFALENFDAIGKWRTTSEAHTPIDASASLADGTTFDGPSELRKLLLARRDNFVLTVTEKLLTYALGRGAEYYDRPAIRKIVREAASHDDRWSSLVLGITKSVPFQMSVKGQE